MMVILTTYTMLSLAVVVAHCCAILTKCCHHKLETPCAVTFVTIPRPPHGDLHAPLPQLPTLRLHPHPRQQQGVDIHNPQLQLQHQHQHQHRRMAPSVMVTQQLVCRLVMRHWTWLEVAGEEAAVAPLAAVARRSSREPSHPSSACKAC